MVKQFVTLEFLQVVCYEILIAHGERKTCIFKYFAFVTKIVNGLKKLF